ncbi:MAG: PD-(D/E)XK nuclease family protein [Actinomycetia bacterium]|nr:PD-(D/E)XK nuclease family protein [Actinomycetes bacterium]
MTLPLPATLTPSKISTYTNCALAATRGTLVHGALEHLLQRPAPERVPRAGPGSVDAALAGRTPPPRFENQRWGGVHFYALLCEQVFGRRPAKIQLLHLAHPVAIMTTPSEQSSRGLSREVSAIWQAVERSCGAEDFRPRPSRPGDWYSFRQWCSAHGGDPATAPRPETS